MSREDHGPFTMELKDVDRAAIDFESMAICNDEEAKAFGASLTDRATISIGLQAIIRACQKEEGADAVAAINVYNVLDGIAQALAGQMATMSVPGRLRAFDLLGGFLVGYLERYDSVNAQAAAAGKRQ